MQGRKYFLKSLKNYELLSRKALIKSGFNFSLTATFQVVYINEIKPLEAGILLIGAAVLWGIQNEHPRDGFCQYKSIF
ncbi:MAG: hypothetical protein HC851_17775 [Acaryochloris sp. RU_4_1]|nr:hypothetical protein [Acaryochloris sp. RU_4_1]NJN38462.1 hypothetical protein [Acaryochloridaceae cyanobacterium CSU_3_4]NJR55788.1 hypothetical protein [Acaryochloris sp. CRU_2_0]